MILCYNIYLNPSVLHTYIVLPLAAVLIVERTYRAVNSNNSYTRVRGAGDEAERERGHLASYRAIF